MLTKPQQGELISCLFESKLGRMLIDVYKEKIIVVGNFIHVQI